MANSTRPVPTGYTLLETLLVLSLLAVLLGVALPPLGRWRDRAAVAAAREELAGALAWTRTAAVSTGGAELLIDPATGRVWTEGAGRRLAPAVDLARRYRVRLDPGSDSAVRIRYDALGIGRVASRTVRIRRGTAVAGITISAYGRFRRW